MGENGRLGEHALTFLIAQALLTILCHMKFIFFYFFAFWVVCIMMKKKKEEVGRVRERKDEVMGWREGRERRKRN